MTTLTKSNALDASALHPDTVLRYYEQGLILWMPVDRWSKMMRHLQGAGKSIRHRGRSEGVGKGVVFQKLML